MKLSKFIKSEFYIFSVFFTVLFSIPLTMKFSFLLFICIFHLYFTYNFQVNVLKNNKIYLKLLFLKIYCNIL